MEENNIGYLRDYRGMWYLIPSNKLREWEAYMEIMRETNHKDWFVFANKFEDDFRRYVLVHSLENLRILL